LSRSSFCCSSITGAFASTGVFCGLVSGASESYESELACGTSPDELALSSTDTTPRFGISALLMEFDP
jgi:hypothetical protein